MNPRPTSRRRQTGSALVEISVSYAALVIVGLLSLKAAINVSSSQSWTVRQSMTDAYMTREVAIAQRIPFDEVVGSASPWPRFPTVSSSAVVIGRLPGGSEVTATIHRTRLPDSNNRSGAHGSGTAATNPANTEAWRLQSILSYQIADRNYVKTRTTFRVR